MCCGDGTEGKGKGKGKGRDKVKDKVINKVMCGVKFNSGVAPLFLVACVSQWVSIVGGEYPHIYLYDASNLCHSKMRSSKLPSVVTSPAGFISLTSQPSYPRGDTCELTLDLRGTGARFALEITPGNLDLAEGDTLRIVDRDVHRGQRQLTATITGLHARVKKYRFVEHTTSSALSLAFHSPMPRTNEHTTHRHKGFTLIWTRYHLGDCDSGDSGDSGESRTEHRCSTNGWCISRELVCDGVRNCWDGSDEDGCGYLGVAAPPSTTYHLSLGSTMSIILALALVAVVVTGVLFLIVKYRRKRSKSHRRYEPCNLRQAAYNPTYDKPTHL